MFLFLHQGWDCQGKELLEERYKSGQLNDKKSREDVDVLISRDGKTLSEDQVKS